MRPRRGSALGFAISVSCLVAALAAQQPATGRPAQQPTFRSRIDLVQVDVVAIDKDGNHVRGLTKDDFALFDRNAHLA